MNTAELYIQRLALVPHPEGGFYKEVYRSREIINGALLPGRFSGDRCFSTSIYFLLEKENFSAFHRIKSDELWHFYTGDPLEIVEIDTLGKIKITVLGADLHKGEIFTHTVPAGTWFASRVKKGGNFSLVGCTVAPGFDFNDFEMASRDYLTKDFPQYEKIIGELTR